MPWLGTGSGRELSPRFLTRMLEISLQYQTKVRMPQHMSALFPDTKPTQVVFQRRGTWLLPMAFFFILGGLGKCLHESSDSMVPPCIIATIKLNEESLEILPNYMMIQLMTRDYIY